MFCEKMLLTSHIVIIKFEDAIGIKKKVFIVLKVYELNIYDYMNGIYELNIYLIVTLSV